MILNNGVYVVDTDKAELLFSSTQKHSMGDGYSCEYDYKFYYYKTASGKYCEVQEVVNLFLPSFFGREQRAEPTYQLCHVFDFLHQLLEQAHKNGDAIPNEYCIEA